MARWISTELRQTIADRANQLCEYCLIAEADTFYGCEVDHIISLKHGGSTEPDNLAYACALCNRAKGSDIDQLRLLVNSRVFSIPVPIVGRNIFVLMEQRLNR
jgi:5-methylcytosine-specific restriction endonuclease McrA